MFYLSVCEECWRGGSVTGVVFHQGWGGPPPAGGAMSRYAAAREQEPRPRAPASIIMLHLSLDNVPPPAGIFWSDVILLQRAAAGTHSRFCFEARLSKAVKMGHKWGDRSCGHKYQWGRHAPDCTISMWCRLHCWCWAPAPAHCTFCPAQDSMFVQLAAFM